MSTRAFTISATTAARRVLAEPGGLVFTIGFYSAVTCVLASLWHTATAANGGMVAGYTAGALAWYVATSEAVTVSLNTRMIEEVGLDIASGAVAVELLRPVSLLLVRIAAEVGRTLPRLAVCCATGLALARLLGGPPPYRVALLLALPSVALAITCNVVAQPAFAAVSFWVRDARSTWFLYQKLVFVIGGMLLPLEVLPSKLEAAAKVLPFMAMAYAPARLASGHVEPQLLAVQAGWLAVLSIVAAVVYDAGQRRLQVVGG